MRPWMPPVLLLVTACRTGDKSVGSDGTLDTGGLTADADGDGYTADEDCDDNNSLVNPGAVELCDGADNDCDGAVDEDVTTTFYADTDGDGFGDEGAPTEACEVPAGHVAVGNDCDDTAPQTYPSAPERCDGRDNDCDGLIDEDVATTFYADADGDGHGDASAPIEDCDPASGYVATADDCDDTDAAVSPSAVEVCNTIDDDCDGQIDEGVTTTFYADADGDGYGDAARGTDACTPPSGHVASDDDCDDSDAAVSPAGTEVCDGLDNDCDGSIDGSDAADALTFYADDDGDGYGDPGDTEVACTQPSGHLADSSDCDDTDSAIHPAALEVCDTVDNNCDGAIDGSDAWWDAGWPYRIPVTLTGASTDVDGPPVALDVDFRAALDALGDTDAFDPDTLRVVVQDCGLGQPEVPSQFLDGWVGIFDKADPSDTSGDEAGAVVFLYDEDGDLSSLETLAAGAVVEVALYFGGTASAPGYTTDLASSSASLSTTLTDATFDSSAGGMLSSLLYDSAPDLLSQADSCCGNSLYMSGWDTDPQDDSGTLTEAVSGPVLAAVSATGSRSSSAGAYRYSYTYWMFAGRPEIYSRVYQETTAATKLSHMGDYTSGIRPWESRSDDLTDTSTTFTVDTTSALYADASGGGWGVAFAYVQAPNYPVGITFYDPYLIVSGNDVAASGSGTPGSMSSGTAYFDHVVMVVLPHAGTYSDIQDTLAGLVEGVHVAAAAAEEQ